ncbi:L-ascorbate metabolism protein UlaG, beta-lactamase superfamily [Reichenbachiella faecimaris]|uniref:L-ascorbate metabolism protein UlaG, beta-lactamase superfamily n=1 Tax=Reichenbachiella faecimaris TaxID=692418 RepID=A0A1W2GI37_REIFA|nr:MBL fold metallo-hydrolase [Reichenbachiella faecimaris]SMD36323.1 L-ascorbate metabolism protein UlaG, beta-lactamase superfamily [Reichenbachiella faecimaris]
MKHLICTILLSIFIQPAFCQSSTPEIISASEGEIKIYPILHATMAIEYQDMMIYVDPYGGKKGFEGLAAPSAILITDIHGDHMNTETLQQLEAQSTQIIAPQAVVEKLTPEFTKLTPLANGKNMTLQNITIEAVPMYNLPEDSTSRHPKGRGNGYVLTIGGKRIYISGDTEDIMEMRALKKIDVAFVCMNLPYTMTVEAAADAVLEFTPKVVYPFHYRGKGGFSDVETFRRLIHVSSDQTEVRLVNWYPE